MSKGRKTKVFRPTDAQRRAVSMLAALHVSWDEIRLCIINPHNSEAIAKSTLARAFRKDLARSSAAFKELVANKYFEKLEAGADWAIRAGLRQRFGWTFEGSQPPLPGVVDGSFADTPEIKIVFYDGPGKPEFDITPPKPTPPATNPYSNAAPDLSRPAIEGPRPRFETDTGAVYEAPREQPPSAFDRGDPTGWMK
jgi:hypothetical protein